MIIKEPGKSEYYIDDIVFQDDVFVDEDYRHRVGDLGGSGIISLKKDAAGIYSGKLDIILGKNISNYP
jgi:protocatechuate 3,4-dioxygenase beta subunit